MNDLAKVIVEFGAVRRGCEFIALCTGCGKHALSIQPGRKRPWVLRCYNCGSVPDLVKRATAAAKSDREVPPVEAKPVTRRTWPEEKLQARLREANKNLEGNRVAQEFLGKRGISMQTARALRFGYRFCYKAPRIAVPYFIDVFDGLYQIRYRALTVTEPKDKWKCQKTERGFRRLFNVPLLHGWDPANERPVVLTESELDCAMMTDFGVAALSVDSAHHVLVDEDVALLKQVRNLVLAMDMDEEGRKCVDRFKVTFPTARVLKFEKKDLGEEYQADPQGFAGRIKRFLEGIR
jgi:hypothetical protein